MRRKIMNSKISVCQSCGLPLNNDNKGSNNDLSSSDEYCRFCYLEGEFLIPNLTLDMQIDRLAMMAIEKLHIPKEKAREMAENILPGLKRWRVV